MLDRHLHPRVKPMLNRLAALLDKPAISPDKLTLTGFIFGVLALRMDAALDFATAAALHLTHEIKPHTNQ